MVKLQIYTLASGVRFPYPLPFLLKKYKNGISNNNIGHKCYGSIHDLGSCGDSSILSWPTILKQT